MANSISSHTIIAGRNARRLAILLGSAAACALFPAVAFAQCAPTSPSDYLCENANGAGQVIAGAVSNVTTAPGFSVNTAGSTALSITSTNGAATYIDSNASSLTATGNASAIGITATNGDLIVRTGGVLSGGLTGLTAVHNGAGNVDIMVGGNVTGGTHGLSVTQNGSGTTNVVSRGTVTATEAIRIETAVGSAGVTLVSQQASGSLSGIVVIAGGSGATTITANGDTTGVTGDGIFVRTAPGADTFNAQATDLTIIASGTVIGSGRFGINGVNLGTGDLTIMSTGNVIGSNLANTSGLRGANSVGSRNIAITAGNTTGFIGILAENRGLGTTSIISNGTAIGTGAEGIRATNNVNAQGITIQASTTTGATDGISVTHSGNGAINITATGAVTGISGNGIAARNAAPGTDIDVKTGAVTGGTSGINVDNRATGNTTVTSTGDVTGQAGEGMRIIAASTTVDMTVNAVNTFGSTSGINIVASGTGATVVNSTGTVTGTTIAGINVIQGPASTGNLTVNANNASGRLIGVQAISQGRGATLVNVTGDTSGSSGDGIFAGNFGAANGDLTVVSSGTATGGRFGIAAQNFGTGGILVTSTGDVVGGVNAAQSGIRAISGPTANGITINATNASGFRGIDVANRGIGTTSIVTTGNVTGLAEGIFAEAQATSGAISIRANNVTGGTVGIGIDNAGTGQTVVNISGVVQGGTAAISSLSSNGQLVTINNSGTIRNQSGLSADRAINITGGSLTLNNSGTLLGTLSLAGAAIVIPPEDEDDGDVAARGLGTTKAIGIGIFAAGEDDVVNNSSIWNSIGGTSDFGIGEDRLNNLASGRIIAATAAGLAETTTYANLEFLNNAGVIALNDGGTGDRLITNGSVSLLAGSTLAFDIGAGNTSDLLSAGGVVTIATGAKATFTALAPGVIGDRHVFLSGSALSGAFTPVTSFTTAFKGYKLGYSANSAFVEFAQLRPLAAAGVTPNQIATAAGVDTLALTNPVRAAALNLPTDAQAQAAFDMLSGEIHPTVRTVMTEDSRLPRNAVLERLGAERPGALWGQAFGNWADSDGNFNAAPAQRDSYGFLAGFDFGGSEDGGLIAGGAVGYLDTDVVVSKRASTASVKTLNALVYAGIRTGGFSIKAGAGYANADIDTQRVVSFTGFSDALSDGYDGSVWQGFAEAGYRLSLGEGYAEPYAALTAIRAHSDQVDEAGGAAALDAASANEHSLMSTGGIRFGTGGSGAFSVSGNIGWQHGFGALDPVNINVLAGSSPFLINGTPQSHDAGIFAAAARYKVTPSTVFELGYDGVLGDASQDHAVKATVRIRF